MCKLSLSGSRDRIKYLLSLVLKVDIKIVQLDLLVVVFYSFISYLQSDSLSLHFHRVIGQHAIGLLYFTAQKYCRKMLGYSVQLEQNLSPYVQVKPQWQ